MSVYRVLHIFGCFGGFDPKDWERERVLVFVVMPSLII